MACCCVVTNTGTVKMVESCGKFSHIARPGLQTIIPCVQSVSGTISMRLQQMEVSCETKSKDNVFLSLKVSIQYQVINDDAKIVDAHYRLTNPRVQVGSPSLNSSFPSPQAPSPQAPPIASPLASHNAILPRLSPLASDRIVRLRRRALDRPQD